MLTLGVRPAGDTPDFHAAKFLAKAMMMATAKSRIEEQAGL
jgi:hypothetical protein